MANSNDLNKFYRKLGMLFGAGIILILIIFLGIIPLVDYLNKPAYLDVLVTPTDAKVEINGAEYRNAVYELEPGTYTATVTLKDASSETVKLNLEKNQTTGLYLGWSSDGGWQYYTAEDIKHRNSIGEIMPIHLSICGTPANRMNCDAIEVQYDRVPECGNEQCIVISGRRANLTDEVVKLVQDELDKNDYKLDDYQYVYIQNSER